MDIEWAPNFRAGQPENPVSLVQLSDGELIVLVHVACMTSAPVELAHLLSDPETIKLGVGIKQDATKVLRDLGITCAGIVELKDVCPPEKLVELTTKPPIRGLSWYVGTYLNRKLAKAKSDQLSNWAARNLTARQLTCKSIYYISFVSKKFLFFSSFDPI
ncbi:ribonuclease H-like domain-containing protein [Mrakia frigida]|uniref:3'-5' exonuclease n=1 Tax=Mrakia frigida TaxID=29902 RepID=UPI003FCC2576